MKLLTDVLAKNPDRKTQATACKLLAESRDKSVSKIESILESKKERRQNEKDLGKEKVEQLLASADKLKKEAAELKATLGGKYGDVFPDLSIGKKAPEVVIQGLDGKEARLSTLRGKVVLLDIWATWCSPCKAMIPHERDMVENLKDRPFALVSISVDEKKKALTDFLDKEKMPWTHWWNGDHGPLIEDWDVPRPTRRSTCWTQRASFATSGSARLARLSTRRSRN